LVESFVFASMRRVHGITMQRVPKALKFVGRELGMRRPLVHAQFRTDGVRLFVERADELLDATSPGQTLLREVLDASLERIGWGHEIAERTVPVGARRSDRTKSIVIDPRRGFGQPSIAGTGVQAKIVAERYRAGESILELAKDYHLDLVQIEDAIRCETSEAA
jgi:uncharacterized protein (DUF433 family)